jgi:hypothetical protein
MCVSDCVCRHDPRIRCGNRTATHNPLNRLLQQIFFLENRCSTGTFWLNYSLGKGEVHSSILCGSTEKIPSHKCPTWPIEAAILFPRPEFGGVVNAAAGREHLVHDRRGRVRGVGGSGAPSRLWAAVSGAPPRSPRCCAPRPTSPPAPARLSSSGADALQNWRQTMLG